MKIEFNEEGIFELEINSVSKLSFSIDKDEVIRVKIPVVYSEDDKKMKASETLILSGPMECKNNER